MKTVFVECDRLLTQSEYLDMCETMKRQAADDVKIVLLSAGLHVVRQELQWIPCSERLPEDDGTYIVSGKWGSGKVSVGECEYYKHDGYFRTAWNFDVIAWMPMPKPYREDEE